MTRWRIAALLLALLLCTLPVRAEEDLPGGGGFSPGWEDDSSPEGEPPGPEPEEGQDLSGGGDLWPGGDGSLPGGGILWPGDWEPPDPEPGDEEGSEPEVDPSAWADGTVDNARELCAWMRSLSPEGGEITLGDTVTLTWNDVAYFGANLEAPAVIHTGPHSLVYDGKGIRVIGQEVGMFQIEGEGVDAPVLEIRGDQFFGSDWNEILAYQEVTASGRGGQGGVAVQVTSDSETRNNLEYYRTRGRIHAYGTRAVGLKLDVPALVNCLDIDVSGEGALAIDGPEGTAAFLCTLTAGAGGSVAGSGVNTDGSILPPEPEGPRIDRRVGIDPQIPLGTSRRDIERIVGLHYLQRYRLTDGSYLDAELAYDEGFAKHLDTSVPGLVDIPVALPKPLQGLGLEGENGLAFRVWIRDPALPILADMEQEDGLITFYTSYSFISAGSVWDPGTRLWRSDDGGVTWHDATGWDAVTWCAEGYSVELFRLDTAGLNSPISLVLENRAGWGNVVTLTPGEEGVITPGTGGDRDGGDREEQPGGDGGQHGGDNPADGAEPNAPSGEPSGDRTSPGSHTKPSPQPDGGEADTPTPQGNESAAADPPGQDTPLHTLEEAPVPEAAPAGLPVEAASPPSPHAAQETHSIVATPASAPDQVPETQPPAQAGLDIPEEKPTPDPIETSETPNPDAETPPPAPAQAPQAEPSRRGALAFPALVLCIAGGLTALVTLRKKRGGR